MQKKVIRVCIARECVAISSVGERVPIQLLNLTIVEDNYFINAKNC